MNTLCLDRLLPHLGVRQPRCAPDRQGNKDEGAVNGIKEVKFFVLHREVYAKICGNLTN